jgi:serine/threonine-protein phosphatase 2A regulatory subunit A
MMDRLVADPIPNIRFNVAKSYAVLINTLRNLPAEGTSQQSGQNANSSTQPSPRGLELINGQIMSNLEKLQQDDDVDVRYFATVAAGGTTNVYAQQPGERMDTGQ